MVTNVYVIGSIEDLKEPYENCYVGVTLYPLDRWKKHTSSKSKIGSAIRENGWNYDSNFKIIWSGSEDDCYSLEEELRPESKMGLNVAVGGHGGYTSYEPERNRKISSKLKGTIRSDEQKKKISQTKIDKKLHVGSKNGMAKHWFLIDPNGTVLEVNGNLIQACEDNNLLVTTLYNTRGIKIPPPSYGKLGGFRPKNEEHKVLRENTTGWTLMSEKEYENYIGRS